MPRSARVKSKSGTYHIVLRGVNKQTIFYDDEDKEVFLNRIKLVKYKFDFEIYAFCFMSNHIHLLLKEKATAMGKILQQILTSYVFWYNSKYERIGNLFQDRYKSEPVEDDEYLLTAVRYIHQNPVNAGIVQNVSEYPWSSYGTYLNKYDSLIDKKLVLSILGGEEQFIDFMSIPEENKFIEPAEKFKISDEKLLKEVKRILKIKEISEIYSLEKSVRNDKIKAILEIEGSSPYQISRVIGVPMGIIRGVLK